MKKGDIAIQYVFIIFVSVIAVFVIVGLLTKWSLDAGSIMCKLSGDCGGSTVDKDSIEVNDAQSFQREIIKHAKICHERASKGQISGDLCYTVKCTTAGCSTVCEPTIRDAVEGTTGAGTLHCDEATIVAKAIIEFDYKNAQVVVK